MTTPTRRKPHVLVIAYCFPPHGAVGTLRTLRLVRQLHADGCELTVVTSDRATYRPGTPVDEDLLAAVPEGVRIVRVRSLLPRLAGTITATPDRDANWIFPAARKVIAMCRSSRPDVLYSSAPPWTTQVVARIAAGATGLPWVADFRDPWARGPWREGRPVRQRVVNGWLERSAVRRADALLVTTHTQKAELVGHYGQWIAGKVTVIANGCDPDEFTGISPTPEDRFVLLHAGSLYGARSPVPLLRAIAALVGRGEVDPARFTLRLLGQIAMADSSLDRTIDGLGLRGCVEVLPRVSRPESLQQMVSASALLLIQPEHPLSIPAKAFEYLAAGRPILAITDAGATADLMRASGSALVVGSSDPAGLERALRALVVDRWNPVVPSPRAMYDGMRRAAETSAIVKYTAARVSLGRF